MGARAVSFIYNLFCISLPRTVDRLWSITEDLNILYKENWTRLAAQEVQLFQVRVSNCPQLIRDPSIMNSSIPFQDTLLRAVKLNSNLQQTGTPPTPKTHKWSYASAFLYSLTLITTIGESLSSLGFTLSKL